MTSRPETMRVGNELDLGRLALNAGSIAGLLATIVFCVSKLVEDPDLFVSAVLVGLSNGALIALVALGYTLVYGIIELINFSHGDLFMLATVLAAFVIVTVFGATTANWFGALVIGVALVVCMTGAAGLNVAAERLAYRRLRRAPKLAPLITAV